jgi:hypothetical protein
MNKEELKELEKIHLRQEKNLTVFSQIASYLNNAPCTITKELIEEITGGNKSLEEYAYATFLSDLFTDDDAFARELFKEYYSKSVKRLDENEYYQNPYYKSIKIPNKQIGKWTLGVQEYQHYEAFIRDDIIIDGYKEIPQIGYFDKKFIFPTVFENGVEWMAIKPNEIETMKNAIKAAHGDVLVYGLGLGYYAYMISLMEAVTSITIIERDESVIKLFKEYILPQFENKYKIKIVKGDAFDYAENEAKNHKYDFAFVDLWHDVSDGTEMYMKMKKLEKHLPNTEFFYWIEKSILSAIRVRLFDTIFKQVTKDEAKQDLKEIKSMLSDDFIRGLIAKL